MLKNIFSTVSFALIYASIGCGSAHEHSLIESDLNEVELQEKIWALSESGNETEAQSLRKKVADTLSGGNCNVVKKELGGGGGEKRLLNCDHGIQAIYKFKNIPAPFKEPTALIEDSGMPVQTGFSLSDANAEIAAYQLDTLFRVNVVPVTVERFEPDYGFGSAQYFIKNATSTAADLSINGFRRMKIFDFIIRNTDRWENNWLLLPNSNHIVAIDHGLSFRLEGPAGQPILSLDQVLEYLKEEPAFQDKILNTSDRRIKEAIAPYLRNVYIAGVLQRIKQIQQRLR